MKYTLTAILLLATAVLDAQTALTIEGQTYTNSDPTWYGVNIARSVPTKLTFRNNSITSINTFGYMLQAGDEEPVSTNNNLDGAVITGNRFIWNGSDMKSITHGLFTGHTRNAVIKFNYLDHVPMGIIRKSGTNMSDSEGGVAYNILKSGAVGINIKGISNVRIYNNTLYNDRTTSETWRGLIYIYTHIDVTPNSVSHGTKIYNNIFYTKHQTYCIQIDDAESTVGLESDYNIFYCESGTPMFYYCGTPKTFAEWQALGYDTHSRVINPNFNDLVSFVPATRLDCGKDLGPVWAEGLSVSARWGTTDPEKAMQNGIWQVGAIIHKEIIQVPANKPPTINISSPTKGSTAFIAPASITIEANATDTDGTIKRVEFFNGASKLGERTGPPWSFTWKEVGEGTYTIKAVATDNSDAQTSSDPVTIVVEKSAPAVNQMPSVAISSPGNNGNFESPARISITANASDPDGTIEKVEFYIGQKKIGESQEHPYSIRFEGDSAGTYEITAIAYDNLSASSVSEPVRFVITARRMNPDLLALYPNPNNGTFILEVNSSTDEPDAYTIAIISLSGRTIYSCQASLPETRMEIDITSFQGGNYIVTATSNGKVASAKQFVKL